MIFYLDSNNTLIEIQIKASNGTAFDSGTNTLRIGKSNVTFIRRVEGAEDQELPDVEIINGVNIKEIPGGWRNCTSVYIERNFSSLGNLFSTFDYSHIESAGGVSKKGQWYSLEKIYLTDNINKPINIGANCFSFTRSPKWIIYSGGQQYHTSISPSESLVFSLYINTKFVCFTGQNHFHRKVLDSSILNTYSFVEELMDVRIHVPSLSYWTNIDFEDEKANPFTDSDPYVFFTYGQRAYSAPLNLTLYVNGLLVGNEPGHIGEIFSPSCQDDSITTLKKYTFAGFRDITRFDLSNTKIEKIETGAFSKQLETHLCVGDQGMEIEGDKYNYYSIKNNSSLAKIDLINNNGDTILCDSSIFDKSLSSSKPVFPEFKGSTDALNSLGPGCDFSKITITGGNVLNSDAVWTGTHLNNIIFYSFPQEIASNMFFHADKVSQIQVTLYGEGGSKEVLKKWAQIKFATRKSNPMWAGNGLLSINSNSNYVEEIDLSLPISDFAFAGCTQFSKIYFDTQEGDLNNLSIGIGAFQYFNDGEFIPQKTIKINNFNQWLQIRFGDEYSNPWCASVMGTGKSPIIIIEENKLNATTLNLGALVPGIQTIKSYSLPLFGSYIQAINVPDTVTTIEEKAFFYDTLNGDAKDSIINSINLPFSGKTKNHVSLAREEKCFGYIFGSGSDGLGGASEDGPLLPSTNSNKSHIRFYIPKSLLNVTIRDGDIAEYSFSQWQPPQMEVSENTFRAFTVHITGKTQKIGAHAFSNSSIHYLNIDLTENEDPISQLQKIGDYAFDNCESFGGLQIQYAENGSVKYDSASPFKYLSQLTQIGNKAFYNCPVLIGIDIDLGEAKNLALIGRGAFAYTRDSSDGKSTISLPFVGKYKNIKNAKGIDETKYWYIFDTYESEVNSNSLGVAYPKSLTKVIIKNAQYGIPEAAFGYYNEQEYNVYNILANTIKSITLDNCGTQIGKNAFRNLTALTEFNVIETQPGTSTVTNIIISVGSNAFSGCTGLSMIKLPNNITELGEYVFSGCSGLQSIFIPFLASKTKVNDQGELETTSENFGYLFGNDIPSDLSYVYIDRGEIGTRSFQELEGHSPITLELGSISTIKSEAFKDCTILEKINIPSTCSQIESNAFSGCSLQRLIISHDYARKKIYKADAFRSSGTSSIFQENAKCLINSDNLAGWCTSTFENDGSNPLMLLGSIYLRRFQNLKASDLLKKVGLDTDDEEKAEELINPGETPNGDFVWERENLFGQDKPVYSLYQKLTELVETDLKGTTSLLANVFSGWESLETVELPQSITSIERGAFANCWGITTMTVPFLGKGKRYKNGEEAILGYWFLPAEENATEGDAYLTTHYCMDSQGIPQYYKTPKNLNTIVFKGENIGDYALAGVNSLQYCNFSNANYDPPIALKYIGKEAFADCSKLIGSDESDLTEPNGDGVTLLKVKISAEEIGARAFKNCFSPADQYDIFFSDSLKEFIADETEVNIFIKDNETFKVNELSIPFIGLHRHYRNDQDKKDSFKAIDILSNRVNFITTLNITGEEVLNDNSLAGLSVEEINLNDEILKIGSAALQDCSSLRKIKLPTKLREIGEDAFRNAFALDKDSEIDLDFSDTQLETIGNNAFTGAKITELILPNTVTEIGEYICGPDPEGTFTIKNLVLPFIPESTRDEEGNIESGIAKLVTQTLAESYRGLRGLQVKITRDPIKEYAFYNTNSLITIKFDSQVPIVKIPKFAFAECNLWGLSFGFIDEKEDELYLPQNLIIIESHAFYNSRIYGIEKIFIPKTVQVIEEKVFWRSNIEDSDQGDGNRKYIFDKESLCQFIDISSFRASPWLRDYDEVYLNSIDLVEITNKIPIETQDLYVYIYCPLTDGELKNISKKTANGFYQAGTFIGIDHLRYPPAKSEKGKYAAQKADFDYGVYIYDNAEKAFLPIQDAEVCMVKTDDWRTELYYQGAEASNKTFSANYYFAELNSEWSKIYDMRAERDEENIEWLQNSIVPIYKYAGGYRKDINQNDYSFWLDFIEGTPDQTVSTNLSQYSVNNIGRRTKVVTDTNTNCVFAGEVPNYTYVYRTGENLSQIEDSNAIQISEEVYKNLAIGSAQNSAFEKIQELLQNHTSYNETVNLSTIPIYHLDGNTRVTIEDKDLSIDGDYLIKTITLPLTINGTSNISLTKCLEKTI